MTTRRTVLVAPLDWGLGHAGRSVPLIRALRQLGCQVLIASAGDALALLRAECPDVPAYELPAYGIRYPTGHMAWNMLRQAPRLAAAVGREHRWLRRFVREHPLDLVISDSRFGCFHPRVPGVLLTHQLEPIVPVPGTAVRTGYRAMLHRFREIWIPDFPPPDDLAGCLSDPGAYRVPVRYLGWLSRFEKGQASVATPVTDLLVLLSGPEPQRTRLEERLWPQLQASRLRIRLVRGLPGQPARLPQLAATGSIIVENALYGEALQTAIVSARVVLCRSGYSTLMDLAALRRPAILIPTPGQTEQLYLAERVQRQGWGLARPQATFQLSEAWPRVHALPASFPASPAGFSLERELCRAME